MDASATAPLLLLLLLVLASTVPGCGPDTCSCCCCSSGAGQSMTRKDVHSSLNTATRARVLYRLKLLWAWFECLRCGARYDMQ